MTLHAIKNEAERISNEALFYCDREELVELLKECDFGRAINYRLIVITPPARDKTKGGIIMTGELAELEASKTSVGRIVSRGSTVGNNPSLIDCQDLRVGDYIKYQYYAAGLPEKINGVSIKYLVDDQVMGIIENPDSVARLYDYGRKI